MSKRRGKTIHVEAKCAECDDWHPPMFSPGNINWTMPTVPAGVYEAAAQHADETGHEVTVTTERVIKPRRAPNPDGGTEG